MVFSTRNAFPDSLPNFGPSFHEIFWRTNPLTALEMAVTRSADWAAVSSPRNRSKACGIGSGGGGEQGKWAKRPEYTLRCVFVCSFISWVTSMRFDFFQGSTSHPMVSASTAWREQQMLAMIRRSSRRFALWKELPGWKWPSQVAQKDQKKSGNVWEKPPHFRSAVLIVISLEWSCWDWPFFSQIQNDEQFGSQTRWDWWFAPSSCLFGT